MVPRKIHLDQYCLQRIEAPATGLRMEGVAICEGANILGTALSDGNMVCLYGREGTKRFSPQPYLNLGEADSPMEYPHDLAFSLNDNGRHLAVALRSGKLLIFRKEEGNVYGSQPSQILEGEDSELHYSDGVAFLPPSGNRVAVCNATHNSINIYNGENKEGKFTLESRPSQTIIGGSLHHPDGISLTSCGGFLASANHHGNTVSIMPQIDDSPIFNAVPVQVISDQSLAYPHSLQFSPRYGHLLVTCAGANYINVYHRHSNKAGAVSVWSETPDQQLLLGDDAIFHKVNDCNKQEGGPKGIAMSDGLMAFCRADTGLSLFSYDECAHYVDFQFCHQFSQKTKPVHTTSFELMESGDLFTLINKDTSQSFTINPSSALIWTLCNGKSYVEEIGNLILNLYPGAEGVKNDVMNTLKLFYYYGAIDFEGAGKPGQSD